MAQTEKGQKFIRVPKYTRRGPTGPVKVPEHVRSTPTEPCPTPKRK